MSRHPAIAVACLLFWALGPSVGCRAPSPEDGSPSAVDAGDRHAGQAAPPTPAVLLVCTTTPGVAPELGEDFRTLVEEELARRGFPIVESSAVAAEAATDPAGSALYEQHGVGCLVRCELNKRYAVGGARPETRWIYLLTGGATRCETGRRIGGRVELASRDASDDPTQLGELAASFCDALEERLATGWAESGVRHMLVFVSGLQAQDSALLPAQWEASPRLRSCHLRRVQRGTAEYDIAYAGSLDQLLRDLAAVPSPALELTLSRHDRVDLAVRE